MPETTEQKKQRAELAQRLTVALVIPLILLVAVAGLLGAQILRMASDSHWVDHSDEVLAKTNEVFKQIIDQETGVRGYLVTGDSLYLQPYRAARPTEGFAEVQKLVGDNPAQLARVDEARKRYLNWLLAEGDIDHRSLPDLRTPESMRLGKSQMDDVRASIHQLMEAELDIRRERSIQSESSRANTEWLFVGLFALTALVLATTSRRQLGSIAKAYGDALVTEREARAVIEDKDWVGSGTALVAEQILGELTLEELGERALKLIAPYTDAAVGNFYSNNGASWKKRASFGSDLGANEVPRDQTLLARAASSREIIRLDDVPEGYLKVKSSLGEHESRSIVIVPLVVDGQVYGVLELGFWKAYEPRAIELLQRVSEGVAISIRTTSDRLRLRELLEESQHQAEELQTQQEELRVANEELEERSTALREAHAQVETRQEELEVTNSRLAEQARQLTVAQERTLEKSAEVERSSRYKSEFLANMSHELRTPLNSSLILSKLLADNKDGNLTEEQVKFASTIYAAGNDLLTLINDVLDLAKVEAGKLELHAGATSIARLTDTLSRTFNPIAGERGIAFVVQLEPGAPEVIETDAQRLEQILKNLLSNALKFTEKGEVRLTVSPTEGNRVRFVVKDTGIGIPPEHRIAIFEAFRQVDATIQRKYGGTGLGLSISRDFALLLGGTLEVESEEGKGSTFTLTLPMVLVPLAEDAPVPASTLARSIARPSVTTASERPAPHRAPPAPRLVMKPSISDDRDVIDRVHRLLLVVEDDVSFAQILVDLSHERQFQCIV
ncbi:MAG: ATP-binding protein, partial [Polyangiaceae bacterium]